MPNNYFKFKQFTIYHDLCAMKVGTDGVLLGAWTDCVDKKTILDIGTGSGLIALMLAQRSKADIDAIDIDENAYLQSKINFENSPFRERLTPFHSSLQNFITTKKYDLIVSNPPYFSDSLKSPDENRSIARHNDSLSFEILFAVAVPMLFEKGSISLIIPYNSFNRINEIALSNKLNLCRKTMIFPTPDSDPKRILVDYSYATEFTVLREDKLIIEISRHNYSKEYKDLTGEFYL